MSQRSKPYGSAAQKERAGAHGTCPWLRCRQGGRRPIANPFLRKPYLAAAAAFLAAAFFLVGRGLGAGVVLYASSLVVDACTGWGFELSLLVVGFVAVAYTALGGLVADVFKRRSFSEVRGEAAIGHVRYSTSGDSNAANVRIVEPNITIDKTNDDDDGIVGLGLHGSADALPFPGRQRLGRALRGDELGLLGPRRAGADEDVGGAAAADPVVVAVGAGARDDDGDRIAMDVKEGDKILFGKWSGTEITLDGEELLIMKESDILGVIS